MRMECSRERRRLTVEHRDLAERAWLFRPWPPSGPLLFQQRRPARRTGRVPEVPVPRNAQFLQDRPLRSLQDAGAASCNQAEYTLRTHSHGKRMHCLITGGSGFIGSALCRSLVGDRHEVTVLTRDSQRARRRVPEAVKLVERLDDAAPADAVVNLAGENL